MVDGQAVVQAQQNFAAVIPLHILAKAQDPNHSWHQQLWPQAQETEIHHAYTDDPVADHQYQPIPGVIHKYQDRVLIIAAGHCAVHCRYCFRRQFPYGDGLASRNHWSGAIDYIRARPKISEVILSGGDPLTLSTDKLKQLTDRLAGIVHIHRLRIHTRIPMVLPDRCDDTFLTWLRQLTMPCTIVLHINHADEFDASNRAVISELKRAGALLLNQSVLLKNVNDSAEALIKLSHSLVTAGILPYYLNLLDKVSGTAHFEIDDETALSLHRQIRTQLPGYMVPRLVRDEGRSESKTLYV